MGITKPGRRRRSKKQAIIVMERGDRRRGRTKKTKEGKVQVRVQDKYMEKFWLVHEELWM